MRKDNFFKSAPGSLLKITELFNNAEMLKTKLAFVSGAASGIGRSTCIALAREGAKIVAADINFSKLQNVIQEIGNKENTAYELDVSKPSSVEKVFKDIVEKYGQPPTVIVTCAGITKDSFLLKMEDEDFDNVIKVNLKGTYLVLKNSSKLLIEHNLPGSIITISSIIGKIGNFGQTNYSASKAGVELMTKSSAMELGKYGIRCNTILPGFIQTPMVETIPEKLKEMFSKRIALGRFGTPEEVAEVIVFLASDKSSYVNGSSLEVTGGGL